MPEIVADNISVVESFELRESTRIEAEYYQPKYLRIESQLKKYITESMGNLVDEIRCGPFGSTILSDTYVESGVIVARPFNIKNFSLEYENLVYINEKDCFEKNLKFYSEGDIFFSRVGDVRCGVVPKFNQKITISPNIIAVKIDRKKLNPYYVAIFFNSKYGFPQIERALKVVAQPTISTDLIKNLKVVLFSKEFQLSIEKSFSSFFELHKKSTFLYSQAEDLLLSELGIKDIDFSHELCYKVTSADTITANRIDAEYYQPKYEKVIEAIKNSKFGWCKLADKITNITDKYDPKKEPEKVFKYIELSNINFSVGVVDGYLELKGKDLPSRARMLIKKDDVILSSVEGSIEKVALIDYHHDDCLASTGFFVFRSKDNILPEYTLALCKSVLIQKQLEKLSSGTILTAVPKSLVKNIIIPDIPKEAQKIVASLIQQSHSARRKAKELLEEAKQKVEEMIEKGATGA
ncbi:MAG: restriction endonuclease subunit S [Nitrospirae bacterium]|nr:restriction endonuclease subunit S [Nitrospirota bacterium]